jgi:putative DNA methylase
MTYKRKLIEVSIPLDVINDASAYDKMPGIGAHPKGIHHWWARLPLPSARAILFASLVDDPSSNPDQFPTEEAQEKERARLFEMIRLLCQKKMHTKQHVFEEAHQEILKHCDGNLPTVLDPFAGGGSIPLEGMRLGLPVQASDLNPVAVLINKAQLEILPQFANQVPINPEIQAKMAFTKWELGKGLAEDLRYYGKWINEEAKKRIGQYYPKAKVGNKEHNVITWLWARTVKCPNPACGCEMPLVRSFILSSKKKPNFYSQPIVEHSANGNKVLGYEVLQGDPKIKGTVSRSGATCVCCNEPIKIKDIREYGKKHGYGIRLIGMVVEVPKGKTYISPAPDHEKIAQSIDPIENFLLQKLPINPRWFSPPLYGLTEYWQLFSRRQLMGLITLHELIGALSQRIILDGGNTEYAQALQFYLTMTVDRLADFNNSLCRWKASGDQQMQLFNRQSIPMVWDFPEANIWEPKAISWANAVDMTADALETVLTNISQSQNAKQFNASKYSFSKPKFIISTDPPYYDNIGYSDLSDFFYVWLRHSLLNQFPELLSTVLVPKMEELVANDLRYGGKEAAKNHFENGFKETFENFKKGLDPRFPLTVYYAFKQDEDEDTSEDAEITSNAISLTTGWETLLESLVSSGFHIVSTWPIKASQKWRMVAMGTNALTSYIVLACRPRPENAASITRREYLQILKRELPQAIEVLQRSNLAPVDMAQATIGPGMGIYSRYEKIMEQDGTPMSVRTTLSLINKTLGEILAEQEGDFDTETRWALAWFEQMEFAAGDFGDANALALAKNTAVNALVHAGIVKSGSGKVQLIPRTELSETWDPATDNRVVVWEMAQHLIKRLQEKGELAAARLYKNLGVQADVARELAYHLFTICEKKGWAQEAQAYNSLVLSWNQIVSESFNIKDPTGTQTKFEF